MTKTVWRFYCGPDRRWRWQQLSLDHSVVAESPTSYDQYENCLAAAQADGYVFQPSQATSPRHALRRV
ncbi:MAG TPA: hypothetical protein VLN59_02915 [Burkholderiales bacterium]|nr:hypothetical protein [Burkholderiales bacterium]